MWNAAAASRSAGVLTRRSGRRAADVAAEEYRTIELAVQDRWGGTPLTSPSAAWVEKVVDKRLEDDPQLLPLDLDAAQRHVDLRLLLVHQAKENAAMRDKHSRARATSGLATEATREQASINLSQLHNELNTIDALSPTNAARLIHERHLRAQGDKRETAPTAPTGLVAASLAAPRVPPPRDPGITRHGI